MSEKTDLERLKDTEEKLNTVINYVAEPYRWTSLPTELRVNNCAYYLKKAGAELVKAIRAEKERI